MSMSRMLTMLAVVPAFAGVAYAQCPTDDASGYVSFELAAGTTIASNTDVKVEIVDHDYDTLQVSVNAGKALPVPLARLTDLPGPKKEFTLRVGPRKSKAEVVVPEGAHLLFVRTYKGTVCKSQSRLEVVGADSRVSAVIVGINKYQRMRQLYYAEKDASDFEMLLRRRVPDNDLVVKRLVGAQATADNIEKALYDATRPASDQGTVLIYFSGHGILIDDMGKVRAFLVPFDAENITYPRDFISHKTMLEDIAASKAKNRIVILDACFSGFSLDDEAQQEPEGSYVAKSITAATTPSLKTHAREQAAEWGASFPQNVVWFSGSQASQVSYEAPDLENGVFTHFLMLAGANGVSYTETFNQVMRSLGDYKKSRQRPFLHGSQEYLQTVSFPLNAGAP